MLGYIDSCDLRFDALDGQPAVSPLSSGPIAAPSTSKMEVDKKESDAPKRFEVKKVRSSLAVGDHRAGIDDLLARPYNSGTR